MRRKLRSTFFWSFNIDWESLKVIRNGAGGGGGWVPSFLGGKSCVRDATLWTACVFLTGYSIKITLTILKERGFIKRNDCSRNPRFFLSYKKKLISIDLPTKDSGVDNITFTRQRFIEVERESERQEAIIHLQHFSTVSGWKVIKIQATQPSKIVLITCYCGTTLHTLTIYIKDDFD